MFNLSPSPAIKAMICDDTSEVHFLTLDHVVPLDPIDGFMETKPPPLHIPMETQPPVLLTPNMTFMSISDPLLIKFLATI